MSSSNLENLRLRSLIWITRKLQNRPMSLKDLNRLWVADVDISGGEEIERRTFNNYIHAIGDLFSIHFECDLSDGYKYKQVAKGCEPFVEQMMVNYEQNMMLQSAKGLEGRILLEEVPGGREYLDPITRAMKTNHKITIEFHDFNAEEPFTVTGAPYALKLYQQRWYVVIREDDGFANTYCLDRITRMVEEKDTFEMDPEFNTQDFFKYCFGVRVQPGVKPDVVRLKVRAEQCGYLRSLPLHPSQQEVQTYEDYSIFTLEVVPTIELTMKLLSMGELVEVLEPFYLRETIMDEAEMLYETYFPEENLDD